MVILKSMEPCHRTRQAKVSERYDEEDHSFSLRNIEEVRGKVMVVGRAHLIVGVAIPVRRTYLTTELKLGNPDQCEPTNSQEGPNWWIHVGNFHNMDGDRPGSFGKGTNGIKRLLTTEKCIRARACPEGRPVLDSMAKTELTPGPTR